MDEQLIVPVRPGESGIVALRTGRLDRTGERVGIAFTSEERLRAALGGGQRRIRLGERALRSLLRPMGITRIQVDPLLVGPEFPAAPAARGAERVVAGAR
ncbi:SAV_915 family protein [Spirillospora sp. NPDC029432]|uniref:SAV_915 family protein n=1 Tax=Spirillospora sp. NPDC029432 TaxID=3154599 RepID=UPI0034527D0B